MEHRIEKGEHVFIHSRAYVAGNVTLGDNANVWCGACIRGDLAPVKIGGNTNVQDNATVHVGYNVPCEIGSGVTVGHNAVVHGAKIGNNVLVGMGAIVLDGAVVEDGCILGAGTLVPPNKVIPAGSVVVGNPYKIVRRADGKDLESILLNASAYIELAKAYRGE